MDFEKLEPDVTKILTKHFTSGRSGRKVEFVGIHYMASNGDTDTCYATWQSRERPHTTRSRHAARSDSSCGTATPGGRSATSTRTAAR